MSKPTRIALWALSLYIAFVFVQSLFFKFVDAPETIHIFGTLDGWAASFGLQGIFAPGGIFSAKVIGSAELVASIILLAGLLLAKPLVHAAGALLAMGIISGAIVFHLFTPLGINVQGDGGILFFMAGGVWVSAAILVVLHKDLVLELLRRATK